MDKLKIKEESIRRTLKIRFGDEVTNICAGGSNPMKHCYFVENKKNDCRCTDRKGKFWDICRTVIYPGHLSEKKRSELYYPDSEEMCLR